MTGAIIEAHDLVKRFGPSPALDGASSPPPPAR